MHQHLCGEMVVLPIFGQQTKTLRGGRQIWSSFYSCWGTKATKSPCYECLNFEQLHPRQKRNKRKGPSSSEKKEKLE
jgi:hypothetical protein